MTSARLALLDVNNFYVSCETVFQPRLWGKACVVLSNNDGCAVSRSAEAKALGVKMGAPWHLIRKAHGEGVEALSSNYALYADMSNRVMRLLRDSVPALEVYSIDEAFFDVAGIPELVRFGRELRERVYLWTGLPVCVGYGCTKVRAKLSNFVAKKRVEHGGVFDLEALSSSSADQLLGEIPVDEVWGVGRKTAPKLAAMGIHTARDLRNTDAKRIREHFSVVLERTTRELQGMPCVPLEQTTPQQQQVMCSRSFGQDVERFEDVREAVLSFTARAAEKLRKQGAVAGAVMVFIDTNRFKQTAPQYGRSLVLTLPAATSDTVELSAWSERALRKIYRKGYGFKKAGVMLMDLSPAAERQSMLFDDTEHMARRVRLNAALDAVNARYGRGTLAVAGAGLRSGSHQQAPRWGMRRDLLTPAYTTRWDELPVVR